MTEEKQIEGMARILAQTYRYPCEETCEDCKPKDAWCLAQEAAKNMQKQDSELRKSRRIG